MKTTTYYSLLLVLVLTACTPTEETVTDKTTPALTETTTNWEEVTTQNLPTPRHEAAFVAVGSKAYLLGGRGIKPVDIYDPATQTWTAGAPSPVEIHHFQPVVYRNEIYLLGAMTGGYPGETPLPEIYIYSPEQDAWRTGDAIPEDRRRGGAGAVLHDGKIYLSAGIVDGHRGGHVAWLDRYDPTTGTWEQLPDAPRPRDHFQSVVHDGKLYNLAGRNTVAATNPFDNCIGEVDVFDLSAGTWSTLSDTLPTLRAGNATLVVENNILVLGGESTAHEVAHDEVEALDTKTGTWTARAPLSRGRHGTGAVILNGQMIMASGCGNRGGSPELADVIMAPVDKN